MEFILLLAVFLTSTGYLFKASIPTSPPEATAPAPQTANALAADLLRENRTTSP